MRKAFAANAQIAEVAATTAVMSAAAFSAAAVIVAVFIAATIGATAVEINGITCKPGIKVTARMMAVGISNKVFFAKVFNETVLSCKYYHHHWVPVGYCGPAMDFTAYS